MNLAVFVKPRAEHHARIERQRDSAIAPDREVQAKLKSQNKPLALTHRVVRIDLTTGQFLSDNIKTAVDPNKIPVRAFQGEFAKRGESMRDYVPSLDPVRVAGSYKEPTKP